MKKRKFKFPFTQLITAALFLFLLFVVFLAKSASVKLPCFIIKEVLSQKTAEGDQNLSYRIDLSYLRGKNIFFVDLHDECLKALRLYPGCKDVRIIKIMPDRLFVDSIMRKPVAIAKLHRNFYVDDSGILFDIPALTEKELCVPQILGLNTKILEAIPGRKYENNNLFTALQIISGLKNNSILTDWIIAKIDVSDNSNMSVILSKPIEPIVLPEASKLSSFLKPESIEIKIGSRYIRDNLNILSSLFFHERENLSNIEYVDLRFKEPVIKFRQVKEL